MGKFRNLSVDGFLWDLLPDLTISWAATDALIHNLPQLFFGHYVRRMTQPDDGIMSSSFIHLSLDSCHEAGHCRAPGRPQDPPEPALASSHREAIFTVAVSV